MVQLFQLKQSSVVYKQDKNLLFSTFLNGDKMKRKKRGEGRLLKT